MVSLQFITHQTDRYTYFESALMALEGGCKWIQLRMKEAPCEEVEAVALQLKPLCKEKEAILLLDDHVELAKNIPVRTLECCSGDLADLKVKSCDVEAWSPRQKKYFEVGSCSNLGDAQARRLKIRIKGKDGRKYFAHTLNKYRCC